MEYSEMTLAQLDAKSKDVRAITGICSSVATVSAWVYVAKKGGSFWSYVGFGFMGEIVHYFQIQLDSMLTAVIIEK